jgi:flagellar biosynthetic protein FliR
LTERSIGMVFVLDPAWLFGVYLVACRLAGLLLLSPILGFATLPAQVRVVFVVLMAAVIAAPGGTGLPSQGLGIAGLAILSAMALLQGVLVGAALRAAIAAFGFGGQLVDFQVGFNAAAILNPATQVQSSLVSTLLEMFGVLLFLLLDLHHVLLKGMAEVFRGGSPTASAPGSLMEAVVSQSTLVFAYGLALVMPVVVGLFLVDVTIAVVSRSMPQINIYFVALPLKVFAGLALVAGAVGYLMPLSTRIFELGLAGLSPAAH